MPDQPDDEDTYVVPDNDQPFIDVPGEDEEVQEA